MNCSFGIELNDSGPVRRQVFTTDEKFYDRSGAARTDTKRTNSDIMSETMQISMVAFNQPFYVKVAVCLFFTNKLFSLCFRVPAGQQRMERERGGRGKKERNEEVRVKEEVGVELYLRVQTPALPTESGTSQRPLLPTRPPVEPSHQVRLLFRYGTRLL